MDQADVIALVAGKIVKAGSLRAYARQIGVSAAYLSDVMRGRRAPGRKILAPLGIKVTVRRIVEYAYTKAGR